MAIARFCEDLSPDYLLACIEQGEPAVVSARKRLQNALFTFDQAQIFTIHSFCARMLKQCALESDFGLHASSSEETLSQADILSLIQDFFRTEIRLDGYGPSQLGIILKEDPEQRKLARAIQSGHSFSSFPSFQESYLQFTATMQHLKKELSLSSEKMNEDFRLQVTAHRNYGTETKAETLAKVLRFTALFDQDEWKREEFDDLLNDGLVWVKALDPHLLKGASPPAEKLFYPTLTKKLKQTLWPLIEQASDFSILLARLAKDCGRLLQRYQREEEKLGSDDILRKMHMALHQPAFSSHLQAKYQAAIIDEFQDTDPLQWQIFRELFLDPSWRGHLYLVGDPKQSIYSFRQADIYTYLTAAQVLGDDHCYSLDVNYRSQPELVNALNLLFSPEQLPHFIPLPKKALSLSCQPVKPSTLNQHVSLEDERGAIHFILADGQAFKKAKLSDLETNIFFPFIAQEIQRLHTEKKLHFHQFAILVRDRHQALRLAEFLDQSKLPYLNQRGTSLADSPALRALIDLLRAVLDPSNAGAMRTALGSPLMGWDYEELKSLESLESVIHAMQQLKRSLFDKGFAAFFQEMLRASDCKTPPQTLLNQLLSQERGLEFHRDLEQIADLVIDHHYNGWNGPEGIIPFLDNFQAWEEQEDERIKRFQDPSKDGIKILTLHVSKGLEFDIVFALGLINRTSIKEDLIPLEREGQCFLTPINASSEEYQRHCEENDAEKMRQFYVALTRAKYRLYLPVALHLPSSHFTQGEASPMDLFLARLGQHPCSYEELYARMKVETGKQLVDFIEAHRQTHAITYSIHQEISLKDSFAPLQTPAPVLQAPPYVSLSFQSLWMTSFSALRQQGDLSSHVAMQAPHDLTCHVKDVHTLPADAETGLLVHAILQKVRFKDFRECEEAEQAIPLVRPFIQTTPLKEWEGPLTQLIFNALKTPLLPSLENFCLAELEPFHLYREMPFLFPQPSSASMIKGVIDLLFYYKNFYYLVDWKTNWLGQGRETYTSSSLQLAMEQHAYFLQASLYTEAMERYLKVVEPRPFKECFGGVFYLFLRGLKPGQPTGIHHFFPSG